MKRLHYHVPECPKCGSKITGRYVRQPHNVDDAIYMESQSLANGELIKFLPREPIKNCYCETCGHEWGRTIYAEFVSEENIEKDIREKGTRERYFEFQKKHPAKKKSFLGKIFGLLPW